MQPTVFLSVLSVFVLSLVVLTASVAVLRRRLASNQVLPSNVHNVSFAVPKTIKLMRQFSRWRANQQAIRELHSMPDSVLKDLGIERDQIEIRVRQSTPAGVVPTISSHPDAAKELSQAA
ncbi:MAG: DUF1127 domain-containing protein [Pseudomonadota bacterium]